MKGTGSFGIPFYLGGRPRKISTRDVLDAIFDRLRTGCPWGFLPKGFPPKRTTWQCFVPVRAKSGLSRLARRVVTYRLARPPHRDDPAR